jgi:hypothetical protein
MIVIRYYVLICGILMLLFLTQFLLRPVCEKRKYIELLCNLVSPPPLPPHAVRDVCDISTFQLSR